MSRILAYCFVVSAFFLGCLIFWSVGGRPEFSRDRAIAPFSELNTPFRIVAFGSSLTQSNPWPDQLAAQLSLCLGTRVEMIRVARNGAGSHWGLGAVDRVLAANPDLVLMEFSINDADIFDGVSLHRSAAQHTVLIERLGAKISSGQIVLMTMNPVSGPHLISRAFLSRYYALLVDLADQYGTALADIYADWLALPIAQRRFADGLHPAPEDTARVIVPGLARRISLATGHDCSLT